MPCHAMPSDRRGAWELMTKPRALAVIRNRRPNSVALSVPPRSVQFSATVQHKVNLGLPVAFVVSTARAWPRAPTWPCTRLLPSPLSDDMCAPWRRDTGAGHLRYMACVLPSASMVDSVTGLRYAERSRAPDHVTDGHDSPMQTVSCTWR